jgi:lysophospholipase L1-like esterase
LVVGVFYVLTRVTASQPPFAPKIILAAMPFLLLASGDLLLTLWYKPFKESTGQHVPHPRRGWTLRPGWTGGASVRINKHGFRGPEIPTSHAPREQRILFLGDSVTFGVSVSEENIFVTRVQATARQRYPNRPLITINAAVLAYSPWQEYDLFVAEGLQASPDRLVHVFCLNDVLEKFRLERFGGYSKGFEPSTPSRLEWSGIYRAARLWRASMLTPTKAELWKLRAAYSVRTLLDGTDTELLERGWRITLENMTKIVKAARSEGLPMVMVCAPLRDQLWETDPQRPTPQEILADFAAQHDVPFLDLLPVFLEIIRRQEPDGQVHKLFIDQLHFSPEGHRLAGDAIYTFLDEQGWFDELSQRR